MSKYSSVHYQDYLELEKILSAQNPRSLEIEGKTAHDEMLFIIIHQVYELWFKQMNHELKDVYHHFEKDKVNEKSISTSVHRLDRVIEILKLLIQQVDVLETMTPLDFLDFRSYLFPASGFQSFQFREFEVLLGLKREKRHTAYMQVFNEKHKSMLDKLENSKSMLDLVNDWLERTPFLNFGDFDFLSHYRHAVEKMLAKEKQAIENTPILSEQFKEMRLKMLGDTDSYFAIVLNEDHHQKLREEGKTSLSYKAMIAALLINLYRDEPVLHQPFRFLQGLTDIDQLVTRWRYRHAHMVLRMLGKKVGTGGSSGHEYLKKTAEKHSIFSDLYNISTLLIPRSDLPELPVELKNTLGFHFSTKA
ncbi:MAG: hypothetical protein HKO89_04970 [Saprospiraceae bacterium]|nr:tryptophan 2,3-dioxygenase [Bacteroidia bacterium]NNK89940.1 hypothetical protein [Saprospiraceae bacterium]